MAIPVIRPVSAVSARKATKSEADASEATFNCFVRHDLRAS